MSETSRQPSPLALLEHVGSGTQNHVFGASRWVVVARRPSLFGFLSKFLSTPRWLEVARCHLGGIVTPFVILDRARFRAPDARRPGAERVHRCRGAIAKPRADAEDFLDQRLASASPAKALDHLEQMVALLERLRVRGFHMFDFITNNFVFIGDTLYISDPGLIVPLRYLWEPTMRFSARGFARGLTADYLRLLGELERNAENDALRTRIASFAERLPSRIRTLRDRRIVVNEEDWLPVEFPPMLEKEIRAAIEADA